MIPGNPELESFERLPAPSVRIWRGRLRPRWESLGFDSDTFDLFVRMKGAGTRLSLLYALWRPMDRLQLARQLGLDWKGVDYHVALLNKHGLVHEDATFGRVKMYRLTPLGKSLLLLLAEFEG